MATDGAPARPPRRSSGSAHDDALHHAFGDAHDDALDTDRRDAVLARLGFRRVPSLDDEGLAALYRAWCRQVPFDNVRKLIALAAASSAGAPGTTGPPALPGGTADDFFDAWLAHGTGGTCWAGANALHVLLRACGFESRRVAASMGESGQPSHGTTVVTLDGREVLVDTSMLTDEPLPLDRARATRTEHPVFGTVAEPVPEGWRFLFPLADQQATLPCRTMSPDAVPLAFFLERYEISRGWSPFNVHVNVRRNVGDGVIGYTAGQRTWRTATGVQRADLTGPALLRALVDEIGLSEQIVEQLARTGAVPTDPAA